MANKGQENLIPFNQRTEEEQREIARQGGIASGEARKEKATMKKTLEMLLETKNKNGQTYKELATLGLLKGAIKGNPQNYKMIVELLGELENKADLDTINTSINNIADLINNPVENRTENNMKE